MNQTDLTLISEFITCSSSSIKLKDEDQPGQNPQETKLISELKPKERSWTSKLIVAEKSSIQIGNPRSKKHQNLVLVDTKVRFI